MICPQCSRDFWALFICDDGVFRCRADRDARPMVVAIAAHNAPHGAPHNIKTEHSIDSTQRPYISRRSAKVARIREGKEKGRK